MTCRWSGLQQNVEEPELLVARAPPRAVVSAGPLRVLIADDDHSIAELLRMKIELYLEGEVDIIEVHSAEAALEILFQHRVDLLLSDYDFSMAQVPGEPPVMNGIALLNEIQRLNIVVTPIFLTGFGTEEVAKNAILHGAVDYVKKPNLDGLEGVLTRAEIEHKARRERARLRNVDRLLEIDAKMGRRSSAAEGVEVMLDVLVDETDCDLAMALIRQPGDGSKWSLRHASTPRHGHRGPRNLDSLDDEELFPVQELDLAQREALFGSPAPARSYLRSLLFRSGDEQALIGRLLVSYQDRPHRLHQARMRSVEVLCKHIEGSLSQRFFAYQAELATRQTIEVLVRSLEQHDEYTAGHSDWVSVYARLIAIAHEMTPREVERAGHAGLLHDIGKVRLDSSMINHDGPLSPEQRAHFQQHPEVGRRCATTSRRFMDITSVLRAAATPSACPSPACPCWLGSPALRTPTTP